MREDTQLRRSDEVNASNDHIMSSRRATVWVGVLGEGESKSLTIWKIGDLHYCETLVAMFDKTPALFISKVKHQE